MTIEEALLAAHDSGTTPTFDPESGNQTFAYEEDGEQHTVWMVDAAATWNQLSAARALGVGSVALWRLGSEDPGVWSALSAWHAGSARPDLNRSLRSAAPTSRERGEILRITDTPHSGTRIFNFAANGLIRGETYQVLPTPYVVARTGSKPKLLALTFDDGPRSRLDPQDPQHPRGEAGARHLLRDRRECDRISRACSSGSTPTASRSATTATPTPTWRRCPTRTCGSSSTPPSGWSRPIPAAARGCFARPISATPSRPPPTRSAPRCSHRRRAIRWSGSTSIRATGSGRGSIRSSTRRSRK